MASFFPMPWKINTMKTVKPSGAYKQMQRLAMVTKQAIASGNWQRAEKCVRVADELMQHGSREFKNAVSNVYVFSVSSFLELNHFQVHGFFTPLLSNEYHYQTHTTEA